MYRVAKEKPADKVPLQNQCLVSCLHSYPSCYYKMLTYFLEVSNCDTIVTHVSMSLAALHGKENPSLIATQLHEVSFTDPNSSRTRPKRQQYGNFSRLAVRELAVQLLKVQEALGMKYCWVTNIFMQYSQLPGLSQPTLLLQPLKSTAVEKAS